MRWFISKKQVESRNKVVNVASYIVSLSASDRERGRHYSLSNLKMQNLLYYCQGSYYRLYDEPLFKDDFEAWPYGPTIPKVFAHFSRYGQNDIPKDEGRNYYLSTQEMEVVKKVWERFGKYYAHMLVDETHNEAPWKEAFENGDKVISKESIKEFFINGQ